MFTSLRLGLHRETKNRCFGFLKRFWEPDVSPVRATITGVVRNALSTKRDSHKNNINKRRTVPGEGRDRTEDTDILNMLRKSSSCSTIKFPRLSKELARKAQDWSVSVDVAQSLNVVRLANCSTAVPFPSASRWQNGPTLFHLGLYPGKIPDVLIPPPPAPTSLAWQSCWHSS